MKLGALRRINKESMQAGGQVPPWVDPLLNALNEFMETITLALNARLTFSDNFLGKEVQISFTHGVETKINPQTHYRIKGLLVLDTAGQMLTGTQLSKKSDGTVGVTLNFAAGAGTTALCTVEILFN